MINNKCITLLLIFTILLSNLSPVCAAEWFDFSDCKKEDWTIDSFKANIKESMEKEHTFVVMGLLGLADAAILISMAASFSIYAGHAVGNVIRFTGGCLIPQICKVSPHDMATVDYSVGDNPKPYVIEYDPKPVQVLIQEKCILEEYKDEEIEGDPKIVPKQPPRIDPLIVKDSYKYLKFYKVFYKDDKTSPTEEELENLIVRLDDGNPLFVGMLKSKLGAGGVEEFMTANKGLFDQFKDHPNLKHPDLIARGINERVYRCTFDEKLNQIDRPDLTLSTPLRKEDIICTNHVVSKLTGKCGHCSVQVGEDFSRDLYADDEGYTVNLEKQDYSKYDKSINQIGMGEK